MSMQAAVAATQQTFATAESTASNPVHAPTHKKSRPCTIRIMGGSQHREVQKHWANLISFCEHLLTFISKLCYWQDLFLPLRWHNRNGSPLLTFWLNLFIFKNLFFYFKQLWSALRRRCNSIINAVRGNKHLFLLCLRAVVQSEPAWQDKLQFSTSGELKSRRFPFNSPYSPIWCRIIIFFFFIWQRDTGCTKNNWIGVRWALFPLNTKL